jgi:hypothetical protein
MDYAVREISLEPVNDSVRGWVNHVRYGDTWGLQEALFAELTVTSRRRR